MTASGGVSSEQKASPMAKSEVQPEVQPPVAKSATIWPFPVYKRP